MFVGHYGPSFLLKRADRETPLWLLFLAVQFVDILWALFILTGIEKANVVDGFTEASPLDLYHMPYTHSLTASIGWAVIVLVLFRWGKRSRGWKGSPLALAVATLSHWFVDLLVHVPDLPLYGEKDKVGFGLWRHLPVALTVEAVVLLVPLWLFLRGRAHRRRYVMFGAAAVAAHVAFTFGPTPPSIQAMAVMALVAFFGLAFVAYRLEKAELQDAAGTTPVAGS